MVRNFSKFSLILALSFGFMNASDDNESFENFEINGTCGVLQEPVGMENRCFEDDVKKLKSSQDEALQISLDGGKSFKSRFVVDDDFVKPKKIIKSLDKSLEERFQKSSDPKTALSYEIHKFSIEKNHNYFWVDAMVEYKLTDLKTNKTFKSNKIFKKYKSELLDSDEIYDQAINDIATEIYDSVLEDSKNHAQEEKNTKEEKELVRQNSKGGIILPFD